MAKAKSTPINPPVSDKEKALKSALEQLEKQFGRIQ